MEEAAGDETEIEMGAASHAEPSRLSNSGKDIEEFF
jgi:hypothetical protein